MKNLFVLPTDKRSKLFIYNGKLRLAKGFQYGSNVIQNQKIYITSDEKIKEDDWGLSNLNEIILFGRSYNEKFYKKIILTTDIDLIKDGVQAIPDDFLEWFIKNPSCETIEVNSELNMDGKNGLDRARFIFKINVPKEEPKQECLVTKCMELDAEIACKSLNNEGKSKGISKETTEEAIERLYGTIEDCKGNATSISIRVGYINGFFDAVKWKEEQNENNFNAEEVIKLMTLAFEQGFKKADIVDAGLEAKETDTEVNWIFLKHKKNI